MELLKNKKVVFWIFLATALILLMPVLVRTANNNSFISGGETYYNIRMAEEIRENGIIESDELQERSYSFNLFHYLLAGLGFVDLLIIAKTLPFIFGMLFFFLAYKLLKRFDFPREDIILTLFFILLTPVFILVFTTLTKYGLVLLLNIAGFYFLTSKKQSLRNLSILLFALIALVDFFVFILVFALLFIYVLSFKKRARTITSSFILSLIFMLTAFLFFHYRITYFNFITNDFAVRYFLTDFGALFGYSFFIFLLAIIGFSFGWKKKKSVFIGLVVLALFIFSFFNAPLRVYLSFGFIFTAVLAFKYLMNKDWSLMMVKRVTLLLILCTLIFSMLSFMDRQFDEGPSQEFVDSLRALHTSTQRGTVLTHFSKGFYVEYFSEMPVVLDDISNQYSGYEALLEDTGTIFQTRDLEFAENYFIKNNVKFILVDEEMRTGLVWSRPQQGLLFLLENSDHFVKVYSDGEIDIYLYKGVEENV